MMRTVFVVLCAAPLVFGQTASNTLRISASRTINAQPDQVVFSFAVSAPASEGLDEVVSGLSSLGVTTANLQSIYGPSTLGSGKSTQSVMQWSFSLPVAYSKAGAVASALGSLRGPLTLVSYGSGPGTSTQSRAQQQCPYTDLVADAQAQAQKVAAASGFTVGPIVAISDGTDAAVVTNGLIPSGIVSVSGLLSDLFAVPQPPPPPCTLVVDFNIERL